MCKNIFEFSMEKLPEREVIVFPENFKSLNILSKLFEINIIGYKTLASSRQHLCAKVTPKFAPKIK